MLSTASDDPIILDSSELFFTQFNGAGQIIAGAGLIAVGNMISVGTVSTDRIVLNADTIDLAMISGLTPGIYGNTSGNYYPYITVDAYGRITAMQSVAITASAIGAQPLNADLSLISGTGLYSLLDARYVKLSGSYADPSWITSLDWGKIVNAPSLSGDAFVQGGNEFGADAVIGTNDEYEVKIVVNSNEALRIKTDGNIILPILAGTGDKMVIINNR